MSAGEISPELWARVDLVKYVTGLKQLRNAHVKRSGGAENRPGFEFVAEVKNSANTVRLVKFLYNFNEIVLEFGDLYMRWFINGDQATEAAKVITGITQASPAVVTSVAHGYSNGDEVYISGVVGMTQVNGRNFKISGVTANTYQLREMDGTTAFNATTYGPYTSGGTSEKVRELVTPYEHETLKYLKYAQPDSVSDMTLVHPHFAPRYLSFNGTTFSLTTITFSPSLAAPTGLACAPAGSGNVSYVVTAVDSLTGEESLASNVATAGTPGPSSAQQKTLTWTAVTGAGYYKVYRAYTAISNAYGLIARVPSNTYKDIGLTQLGTEDRASRPPENRTPFASSTEYPYNVCFHNQRQVFASTFDEPKGVWLSRSGVPANFVLGNPIADDDSINFNLSGLGNRITNIVDIGRLLAFTDRSENFSGGNDAGFITPLAINMRATSYYGADFLRALVVDGSAIFLQWIDSVVGSGNIIRDLGFDQNADGYRGNDLTAFARHFFDLKYICDWDYQKHPNSIIWAVRNDGKLLGLTYIKDQQINGWHRHDTDGDFEAVCVATTIDDYQSITSGGVELPYSSVPSVDTLFVVANRTIDGVTKRYIEKSNKRQVADIRDLILLDSSISFDGRNDTAITMTLSGGVDWDYEEDLTLTASSAFFSASDVGNEIQLFILDDEGEISEQIRCEITAFSSTTVVTVRSNRTVPAALQTTATTEWARAVDLIEGLWHLEGKTVGVFADGYVVGSPNNPAYEQYTIVEGSITLPRPYAVIHVGLPYTTDIETLDIDTDGETLKDKKSIVSKVELQLFETRGVWAGGEVPDGDTLDGLAELKIRDEEGYDEPVDLFTGDTEIIIEPNWNSNGRVFIRQVDPIPMTVNAIMPAGLFPVRG